MFLLRQLRKNDRNVMLRVISRLPKSNWLTMDLLLVTKTL